MKGIGARIVVRDRRLVDPESGVFQQPARLHPEQGRYWVPFLRHRESVLDATAVVDPELRVRNVNRLRVIDASVMPIMVSGNINAAVHMIGEKGAELVKSC